MKKLIEKLDCVRFRPYDGVVVYRDENGKEETLWDVITDTIDVIEKLNKLSDELNKEVSWLRSCKNCKIYLECPRHCGKTVHGCDHWIDVCGERKDNGETD